MQSMFMKFDLVLALSAVGGLILFALIYYAYQSFSDTRSRDDIKKRLSIKKPRLSLNAASAMDRVTSSDKRKLTKRMARKANDFYANSDPKSVRKMQLALIQSGFMNPSAIGYFIAARFVCGILLGLAGIALALLVYTDQPVTNKMMLTLVMIVIGYFLPNLYLKQRSNKLQTQNREGFPDIMDLMVVSSEAGLTMEASIDRIAKEIQPLYPNLSMQLNLAGTEMRAGRPIDQALRAFGDRLGLDEVQGFATLLHQSKKLGTSVSDALRVYSDEMRHKRMMRAEEKAHALPAKMSVPVTLFIMPIVIGVAVIPAIVRFTMT